MDNYAVMLNAAKQHFCTYDMEIIARKPGVSNTGTHLFTTFLGETVAVEKATGDMTVGGRHAGFGEALTVFDWLCDRRETAALSGEFCPVSSLPGVMVRGSGLAMTGGELPGIIDRDPRAFCAAVEAMGGKRLPLGDLGCEIPAFPDLPVRIKCYRADDEFPASMTFLWNRNILQFLRYETVYYLAGCLCARLRRELEGT